MRKFYLLFALLIGISSAAWADISGSWTSSPVIPWTTTAASNVPAGVTAVDDVSATHSICVAQRQVKVSTTGDVVASFTWSGGSHSLIVFGVDLVDTNGDVAKADYRKQKTGGDRNTISYTLNAVDAGNYTLRFWVLFEAKDNDLQKTNGSYSVTGADEAFFDATNASCVVIKNKVSNKYATYTEANVLSENTILTASGELSTNAYFEIAAIDGDGAANGYTIKVKDTDKYVYAISTNEGENNVGIKTVANIDDACKWTIKSNGAGTWYITPFGSANGWKLNGTNTVNTVKYNGIGQGRYNYTDVNCWYILTLEEDGTMTKELASNYLANSAANKVGYPKASSNVASTLTTALSAYQGDNSEANLIALANAVYSYKSETSDVTMPIDGKAYKFTSVSYDGTLRYIKYSSSAGVTLSFFASDATPYICRKIEEGKYAFVNNDGKYLIWIGSDNGRNNNKGYADAYDQSFTNSGTYTDWAKFTLIKLTQNNNDIQSGVTNSDLTGFVSMKARRNTANSYIIVTNSTNNFNQAGENNTYFNASFSTALLMEEVPYANVVSLKDAESLESGKNIATFSAPFPTVVPENTTAYSVETQMASNVTEVSTYKVAEAGEAIPANTGVILMGTDTQVTMLPRTTETTVEIAAGALGNSAGAAKNITNENSYVLANKSGWAFYKVGASATALPMNKAYLVLPENSASVIRFNLVGTTGLDLVGADNAATQGKVYDLSGREVKAAAKGLYIVGGKKVIVK